MADTTAQDTSTIDEVDTSTNEEAQDTDVDLEDIEVSESEITDETDESTDSESEDKDTEPAEEEESEEDVAEETSEDEKAEEDTTSVDDVKKHNSEMAQKRIADKQAREAAKIESQQAYLDEAEDNRDLALRQLQVDAYNNRVERNTNSLTNGIDKAYASIDLLRDGSPEIKEELASSLDDFERMYVIYDQNNDPVDIKVDPVTGQKADVYQYLQRKADSIRKIAGTGARQEIANKDKTKARTDTVPTRKPKEAPKDADLEAFDEEANKYQSQKD